MNPWPIILAGFKRSALAHGALISLIALAVALSLAVTAGERGFRKGAAKAAGAFDLIVAAPGSPTQAVLSVIYLRPADLGLIAAEVLTKLTQDPGVTMAAPVAFGEFHRRHPLVGTIAALGATWPLSEGKRPEKFDEVIIGAKVDLALGYGFHPAHGAHGDLDHDEDEGPQHKEVTFRIVGRMAPTGTPWDNAILVPIETIWWLHGLPNGRSQDAPEAWHLDQPFDAPTAAAPAIVVKPKSVADAYRLRQVWRTPATMAVFPGEVLTDLFRTMGDVRNAMALIAVLAQGLVLGAVLLAAFAALEQRRRTLATLRALGASRLFVFLVLWGHVVILVSLGTVLGLGVGVGFAQALAARAGQATGVAVPLALTWLDGGLAMMLPLAAAALATLPAYALCRQNIAANLR